MPKTLKLMSLGARGVGKTVFLVSNCANALEVPQASAQESLWLECRDQQSKEMVEKLLAYIKQNQAYPPATFKISDFNLSVKKKAFGNVQTLCHLQWTDIPGEWCDLKNKNFQAALLESHGCCIFVDSDALLNQEAYLGSLEQHIKQIEAITSLISQNDLVQYPIALICTKYDLIESNAIGLIQLEEKLKPLMQKIESSKGVTRRFYSAIPLLNMQSGTLHQVTNANDALLWITTELNGIHTSENPKNLGQMLNSITQTQRTASPPKPTSRPLERSNQKKALNLALIACGVIAALAALVLALLPKSTGPDINPSVAKRIEGFESVLKNDPTNESAISGIVDIYWEELGQEDKAIAALEALQEQAPENISLLSHLAQLYGVSGDRAKQDAHYDKILSIDPLNLSAIQGKVRLKVDSGQPDEAREILKQAEQNAKTEAFKALLKDLSNQIPKT